jgi:hypothetical protein
MMDPLGLEPSRLVYALRAAAMVAAALLAGCAGGVVEEGRQASAPVARVPSKIPLQRLVGSWGIASFREEKDRKRTEAQARAQCRRPYVIAKGPTDGVMMHVADDVNLYELTLKGTPDGKTYLGFESPPGDEQDREILSSTNDLMVMRFVGPDIHARYGTFIYVRCSARGTA